VFIYVVVIVIIFILMRIVDGQINKLIVQCVVKKLDVKIKGILSQEMIKEQDV